MAASAQCAACGRALDPLRAGQVAIVGGRFVYFCDRDCKQRYGSDRPSLEGQTLEPPPVAAVTVSSVEPEVSLTPPPAPIVEETEVAPEPSPVRALPPVAIVSESAPSPPAPVAPAPAPEPPPSAPAPAAPAPSPPAPPAVVVESTSTPVAAPARAPSPPRASTALFVVVGVSLALSLAPRVAPVAAAIALGWAAVALSIRSAPRSLRELFPFGLVGALLAPAVLAALFALGLALHDGATAAVGRAAAVAAVVAALAIHALARAHAPLARTRDAMRAALTGDVVVVRDDEPITVDAREVKPGDRVRVRGGERVRVDAVVAQGTATVHPWVHAKCTESRAPGDAVAAGAELVSGELLLDTTWAAGERGLARALEQPAHRPELTDRARGLALPVAAAVSLASGLAAGVSQSTSGFEGAVVVGAVLAALPTVIGAALGGLAAQRAATRALAGGIHFRDASAFEVVGRLERVALCAGSSLLLGEPEVVDVVSVGATPAADVLALAAGAESGATSANGRALVRAAERSPLSTLRAVTRHAGLGVTAQSASGDRVVVGSRRLAMNEAVSIALAESRITDLEKKGRVVVLVAAAERLLGFVALQDGLRPDARATVQRLIQVGVEPVMLTGAARATAETLAAALSIEHVRPEVAPDDRGAEVRALATSASGVGVIGHPRLDDAALGAATAGIALASAGAPPGEWAVALAGDRGSSGAEAVAIARSARDVVRTAVAMAGIPGLVVGLAFGAGLVPVGWVWAAPLVGAAALAAAARKVRSLATDSAGPSAEA